MTDYTTSVSYKDPQLLKASVESTRAAAVAKIGGPVRQNGIRIDHSSTTDEHGALEATWTATITWSDDPQNLDFANR